MLFTIVGKHIEITASLREFAENKVSKLPRYYSGINYVEVKATGNPKAKKVSLEIIARAEHGKVFVVTVAGENVLNCIDQAVRKLQMQLSKRKARERENKHKQAEK